MLRESYFSLSQVMPLQVSKAHWQHYQVKDQYSCVKDTVEFIQLYHTLLPELQLISPFN